MLRYGIQTIRLLLYASMGSLFLFLAGCGREIPTPSLEGDPIAEGWDVPTPCPESTRDDLPEMPAQEEGKEGSAMDTLESGQKACPGVKTLENFLRTALLPVGSTMYVWGGGWNEEDTGAGKEAVSLSVSPNWKAFADRQTQDYDYRETRYLIHEGLDCSGYVGWVVYNVMESENDRPGYVMQSTKAASTYASYGWGDFTDSSQVTDWLPGDVMSQKGHVWISLGTCEDGSVLLVHSSPPGVRLCGTAGKGETSQASLLAETVMKTYYPDWQERFPSCTVSPDYLTNASRMRWNLSTFPDAEEIRGMTPQELIDLLFLPAAD